MIREINDMILRFDGNGGLTIIRVRPDGRTESVGDIPFSEAEDMAKALSECVARINREWETDRDLAQARIDNPILFRNFRWKPSLREEDIPI